VVEIERKFLIAPPDLSHPVLQSAARRDVEQRYLEPDERGGTHRVRRVVEDRGVRFFETVKHPAGPGTREEDEREIDAAAHDRLVPTQLPGTRVIRKQRLVFEHDGGTWELDCFQDPPDLYLLEIELESLDQPIEPPSFLEVIREVTDDPAYANAALAGAT
jgi:CYTH domain-containing protein